MCYAFVHQKMQTVSHSVCPWSSFGGFRMKLRLRDTEDVVVGLCFVSGCFDWSHPN